MLWVANYTPLSDLDELALLNIPEAEMLRCIWGWKNLQSMKSHQTMISQIINVHQIIQLTHIYIYAAYHVFFFSMLREQVPVFYLCFFILTNLNCCFYFVKITIRDQRIAEWEAVVTEANMNMTPSLLLHILLAASVAKKQNKNKNNKIHIVCILQIVLCII